MRHYRKPMKGGLRHDPDGVMKFFDEMRQVGRCRLRPL